MASETTYHVAAVAPPDEQNADAMRAWRLSVGQQANRIVQISDVTTGIVTKVILSLFPPDGSEALIDFMAIAKDLTGSPPKHLFQHEVNKFVVWRHPVSQALDFRVVEFRQSSTVGNFPYYYAYNNASLLAQISLFANDANESIDFRAVVGIDRDYLWSVRAEVIYIKQ